VKFAPEERRQAALLRVPASRQNNEPAPAVVPDR